MIPFLIVIVIAGPVCFYQWWTWPTPEQQRLRRLSRDLRGARFASGAIEDAERLAQEAWAK